MARPLKYFLILLGLTFLAVVGALTYVVATFDPNDYRARIAKLVHDKTGRDLAIGDIGLSVFPWIKVDLTKVSFSNAPGFGSEPMAQVGHAKVGVKLMPLLQARKIEVDGVELDGLVLNLARTADGKSNWDDLVHPPKDARPEAEKQGAVKLEDIDIGGVDIRNAAISYRDDAARQSYRIKDFNLKTGALKPGAAFDVETSLSALLEAQKLDTTLKLSAHVDPDLKKQELKVSGLKLDATARSPTQQVEARLGGEVEADLQTKKFKVDDLALDAEGYDGGADAKNAARQFAAKITGKIAGDYGTQQFDLDGLKIDGNGRSGGLDLKGVISAGVRADLLARRFGVKALKLDATASGASLPGGSQTIALTGDVDLDQASGKGQASRILLKAGGLEVSTDLAISGLNGSEPRFTGPLAIREFNARELLAKFSREPLKTTDPKALTAVSFKANVDGSPRNARLSDLLFKLDQTSLTGSMSVRDFANPAIAFALRADALDADRYLPPRSPATVASPPDKSPQQQQQETAELNKTEIPVEAITRPDVDGSLSVGRFTLRGLKMSEVQIKLAGPANAAKTASLQGQLYGGSLALSTRIAPGARPGYAFKTNLSNLALGPFLVDLAKNDKLSGTGTVALDLTSAGKTVGDVRNALAGTVSLNFKNGAVKGFNLGEIIRRAQSLLRGQPYTPSGEPVQTDFASIDFAGAITNGVLRSDSLDARNPLLRVGGEGEIDLARETLNYTARPTIVESSKGQGGRGLEDLGGVTVPVKLTGTFAEPKYKVDLAGAARARVKEELKERLSNPETRQKLNDKLGGALEGLFGGRKKKQEPPPPAEDNKEQSAPSP